ncbi:MAG: hypothetical protein LC112_13945 [Flavobacteriales bacterium]|nr:hypothetical protein [Flavobacteriales bacterium]
MKKVKLLVIALITLISCKKEATDCPTWTADTYAVAKTTGITPPSPGVVTFKECTNYTSGQVIMYREDANFKYYRRIR